MKYLIKINNNFLLKQSRYKIFFGEKSDCIKTESQKNKIVKSLKKYKHIKYEIIEIKTEKPNTKYQAQKENARLKAIDTQNDISQNNYSYFELMKIQNDLYKLGKKYGLLKEFKENCII